MYLFLINAIQNARFQVLLFLLLFIQFNFLLLFLKDYLSQKLVIANSKLNYLHIHHIVAISQYYQSN